MTTLPEALRLAECLDEPLYATHKQMTEAAELRRLHEKCEAFTADTIQEMACISEIYRLTTMLVLVRDNLFNGMSKSFQKLQAESINEMLGLPKYTRNRKKTEGENI